MKTILNPPDGNVELYEKQCERTKRNSYAYKEQFGNLDILEYATELIAYYRSDARFWKSLVMEEVMETRKNKRKNKNV